MNRRQIGLKLVLDELGVTPSMKTFDDRLILQKTIYLAQQLDVPLGYHFSWYLRGPYSSELTAEAYDSAMAPVPEGWFLDSKTKENLSKVKEVAEHAKNQSAPAREFEKLASVLFIMKTGQATSSEEITTRMKRAGKDFTQQEVEDAIQTLSKFRVIEQVEDCR